jgi:hypothetical protein
MCEARWSTTACFSVSLRGRGAWGRWLADDGVCCYVTEVDDWRLVLQVISSCAGVQHVLLT